MISYDDLGCHKCSEQMATVRGCHKRLEKPYKFGSGLDYYFLDRCFVKVVTDQSRAYLEAYGMFKSGFLPSGGSWMEESIKFVQAMNVIGGKLNEFQKVEMERSKNAKH